MKVTILNMTKEPFDQRVYHKDALALKENGYEVSIVAPSAKEEVTNDGIKIKPFTSKVRTLTSLLDIFFRILTLFSLFWCAMKEDADIYYCTEPDTWLVGLGVKILRRKRIVFNLLEHYPGSVSFRLPKPLKNPVEKLLSSFMKFLANYADHVIFAGEGLHQDLLPNVPDRDATVVLNCSKYAEDFTQQPENNKGEYFQVVFVGRMTRDKGSDQILSALVRAIHQDHKVKAKIIGDFYKNGARDNDYRRKFESRLEMEGVKQNVTITSWVPFEEVKEHLQGSDVGLFLGLPTNKNNNYGPPHKIFDYMARGIPIITSQFLSYGGIITENECGVLVDPFEPEEISNAILNLKRNTKRAREMKKNGLRAAKDMYNWEHQKEKLKSAFETLEHVN